MARRRGEKRDLVHGGGSPRRDLWVGWKPNGLGEQKPHHYRGIAKTIWENRRKYDAKWAPNTWMYRIASNLAIDHLRSRKTRERSQEPVRQHLLHIADGRAQRDLSRMQQTELGTLFRELSTALSEKQKLVFVLHEIEGLSSPEVAKIIDSRESTVRNHLFMARRILREELVRRFPEYAGGFALPTKREDD